MVPVNEFFKMVKVLHPLLGMLFMPWKYLKIWNIHYKLFTNIKYNFGDSKTVLLSTHLSFESFTSFALEIKLAIVKGVGKFRDKYFGGESTSPPSSTMLPTRQHSSWKFQQGNLDVVGSSTRHVPTYFFMLEVLRHR